MTCTCTKNLYDMGAIQKGECITLYIPGTVNTQGAISAKH